MTVTTTHFVGTTAVLVELSDLQSVLALAARLAESPLPGQREVVAAAATVLITCDSRTAARSAAARVISLDLGAPPADAGTLVELAVTYDGEDLAEVARLTGLSVEGVVAAHTGQTWRAAFGGFAPGFAYLLGDNNVLHVPRRRTPRTAVPAGAVALAGNFSAVYPRRSPGGWQLIGHSEAILWSLDRESPALIRPQDRVRFVPARPSLTVRPASDHSAAVAAGMPDNAPFNGVEVVSAGMQSLIQDLGRPGLGSLGVPSSGAADQASARQANRLVGNQAGDAVVENLLGSLVLQAHGDQVLAVTGARAELRITPGEDDRPERFPAQDAPFALLAGETLRLSHASAGLRTYVGVRGGIAVPQVLGSRSTDTMSGIGPAPLVRGSRLPAGAVRGAHVVGHPEQSGLRKMTEVTELRITAGPRDSWFGAAGLAALTGQAWLVSPDSDRIGVRLALSSGGSLLRRVRTGELPSEGVAWGALQVPPSGLPVLFLADHPVTGGYPVIACVIPDDLPAAAQLVPGTSVRFVLVDTDTPAAVGAPRGPAAAVVRSVPAPGPTRNPG